jgi:hypothetical protein
MKIDIYFYNGEPCVPLSQVNMLIKAANTLENLAIAAQAGGRTPSPLDDSSIKRVPGEQNQQAVLGSGVQGYSGQQIAAHRTPLG